MEDEISEAIQKGHFAKARRLEAKSARAGVVQSRGSLLHLIAGDQRIPVKLDKGDARFSGLAGPGTILVRFSQYVEVGQHPEVLAFLQRHEVVQVEYSTAETGFGATRNRTLVAEGCRLLDVELREETGVLVEYTLRAERLSGDLLVGV